mgnify:CR=1 FL=1
MRFVADEGLDAPIVELLRIKGHEVFISKKSIPVLLTNKF